jgi:hypothetical protein
MDLKLDDLGGEGSASSSSALAVMIACVPSCFRALVVVFVLGWVWRLLVLALGRFWLLLSDVPPARFPYAVYVS